MKILLYIIIISVGILSCGPTNKIVPQNNAVTSIEQDTVRIVNDDLEYEIIIIEPGFNAWLQSMARPEGYYSQSFLESRNRVYVQAWNQRVQQPFNYNPNLYEMQIDYQPFIDYGYDVNYKLYNYFIYFQLTYKQRLSSFIPRI
ncbi:DUF6146 family protein [Geojedonia litorea]|uniref:DUF6146 family protein n=1 Tax=Geojedonia litorea TaxID=1268269 RepID=A0ABV9N4M9_9FLAO